MTAKKTFLVICIFLTGCTLMQMHKENAKIEDRIEEKEQQLDVLEIETQQLEKQQLELVGKLEKKRFTTDQLNYELDNLIEKNRQLIHLKKNQKEDVKGLEQMVKDLENSQLRISQLNAEDISISSKENEIKVLQENIKNYLLLGLKAKHGKKL